MEIQKPKKQDLVKLRDEYFEKALDAKEDDEKIQALFEVISLTKKLAKPSDKYKIWISKPAWDEINNDETYSVCEIY